jgi:hypothetical protein
MLNKLMKKMAELEYRVRLIERHVNRAKEDAKQKRDKGKA